MTTTIDVMQEKAREAPIRRALAKDLNDYGEYMIADAATNFAVAGWNYDYSLDDVEEWLNTPEST